MSAVDVWECGRRFFPLQLSQSSTHILWITWSSDRYSEWLCMYWRNSACCYNKLLLGSTSTVIHPVTSQCLTTEKPLSHTCQRSSELFSSEVILNENMKTFLLDPDLVCVGRNSLCHCSCIYPTSSPSSATSLLALSPAAFAGRETEAGEQNTTDNPLL